MPYTHHINNPTAARQTANQGVHHLRICPVSDAVIAALRREQELKMRLAAAYCPKAPMAVSNNPSAPRQGPAPSQAIASRAFPAMPSTAEGHAQARLQMPAADEAAGLRVSEVFLFVAGLANASLDGSTAGPGNHADRRPPTTTANCDNATEPQPRFPAQDHTVAQTSNPSVPLQPVPPAEDPVPFQATASAIPATPPTADAHARVAAQARQLAAADEAAGLRVAEAFPPDAVAGRANTSLDGSATGSRSPADRHPPTTTAKMMPLSGWEVFLIALTVFVFNCNPVLGSAVNAAHPEQQAQASDPMTPLQSVISLKAVRASYSKWPLARPLFEWLCMFVVGFVFAHGLFRIYNSKYAKRFIDLMSILFPRTVRDVLFIAFTLVVSIHLDLVVGPAFNAAFQRLMQAHSSAEHQQVPRVTVTIWNVTFDSYVEWLLVRPLFEWLCIFAVIVFAHVLRIYNSICAKQFIEAVKAGDMEACKKMLVLGAPAHQLDEFGDSALYHAAIRDHVDICKLLVSFGADVNYQHENRNTVLHSVAFRGHTELCTLLLENGAKVDCTNEVGITALHLGAVGAGTLRSAEPFSASELT